MVHSGIFDAPGNLTAAKQTTAVDTTQRERLVDHVRRSLRLEDLALTNVHRLHAGGARSCYMLTLEWTEGGRRVSCDAVLKQDPLHAHGSLVPGSVVLEYGWCEAVYRCGAVRVPQPLFVEREGRVLGSPFILTKKVTGEASFAEFLGSKHSADQRRSIALDAFDQLGRLAAIDVDRLELKPPNQPGSQVEAAWSDELLYWEAVLNDHTLGPLPMIRMVIRRLRAVPPPPPAKLSIVHGDFRLGNFLYGPNGVEAVLDWEMTHLGDPHEDLGWAMSPRWRAVDPSKVWGVLDERALIAAWERGSGLTVNRGSLWWWRLFSHVKSAALWLKAAHAASRNRTDRSDYILVHWEQTPKEEADAARLLMEAEL